MNNTDQKVKEIKQSFRQMMDGATAQSMRDKGMDYHLNWGATIPRLREMADELRAEAGGLPGGQADLAAPSPLTFLSIGLWKENVRECKILATMLMPPTSMAPELADLWMEQTPTLEIAEQAAFNLYQHLPYAADKAFEWLASPLDLPQVCGYHVFSRLFMRSVELNERGINEFLDQAVTALQGCASDKGQGGTAAPRGYGVALQKAAMQAVVHFAGTSIMHRRLAASAFRGTGLDFL